MEALPMAIPAPNLAAIEFTGMNFGFVRIAFQALYKDSFCINYISPES